MLARRRNFGSSGIPHLHGVVCRWYFKNHDKRSLQGHLDTTAQQDFPISQAKFYNIAFQPIQYFKLVMGRYCSSLMLSLTWFLATAKAHAATNLKDCLLESVGGETLRAKFSNEADFQADHIRPYNLNFQYVPFAILYPNSPSEVAGIIVCASQHDRKVQARSGGHDYTNKGQLSFPEALNRQVC